MPVGKRNNETAGLVMDLKVRLEGETVRIK